MALERLQPVGTPERQEGVDKGIHLARIQLLTQALPGFLAQRLVKRAQGSAGQVLALPYCQPVKLLHAPVRQRHGIVARLQAQHQQLFLKLPGAMGYPRLGQALIELIGSEVFQQLCSAQLSGTRACGVAVELDIERAIPFNDRLDRHHRRATAAFHRLLVGFAQALEPLWVFVRAMHLEQRRVLALDAAGIGVRFQPQDTPAAHRQAACSRLSS
ncbi:hypothetical protein D3C73_893870 [compost metagenome]